MFKFVTFFLPLLMRLGTTNPAKTARGQIGVFLLSLFAAIFFLAAIFTWVTRNYGADVGFLTIGIILTLFAIGLAVRTRRAQQSPRKARLKSAKNSPASADDPLAAYISDDLLADPTVQKFLDQIKDKPFLATIVAFIIGLILSTQLPDSDDI
jgi:Na+/phosphate symporter